MAPKTRLPIGTFILQPATSRQHALCWKCAWQDPGNAPIFTLAGLHAFEGDRRHLDALIAMGLADPVIRSIEWILDQPVMPQIHFNAFDVRSGHPYADPPIIL